MEPRILLAPVGDNPPKAELYYGIDVLTALKNLPEKSVHMACTSSPYWGLRSYGTEPVVWDGDPDCSHKWGGDLQHGQRGNRGGSGTGGNLHSSLADAGQGIGTGGGGSFCSECGAWRGELGLEPTPELFVSHIVQVSREIWRVLRDDGVFFINLGDSYANDSKWGGSSSGKHVQALHGNTGIGRGKRYSGLKGKDLVGIPWMVAFALRADGWYLRSDIIFAKTNAMPESVTDRPSRSHEYIFLLSKAPRYFYDSEAVREESAASSLARAKYNGGTPNIKNIEGVKAGVWCGEKSTAKAYGQGHNLRSVISIATQPFPEAHFATWPSTLAEIMVKAGSSEKGCCPICAAPWTRDMERTSDLDMSAKGSTFDGGKTGGRDGGDRTQSGPRYLKQQRGWVPSCDCPSHAPVPCTVLDPFSGSGTTGMVALRLGRNYVGIDLNKKYEDMAVRRILGTSEQPEVTPEVKEGSVLDLFGVKPS